MWMCLQIDATRPTKASLCVEGGARQGQSARKYVKAMERQATLATQVIMSIIHYGGVSKGKAKMQRSGRILLQR